MKSLRVVVVEDEPLISMAIIDTLEDAGHIVVAEFPRADLALEHFRQSDSVDVLVTDMSMPLMSGRQLAEAVRVLRPGFPIVFATGFAIHEKDFLSEPFAFVGKPFTDEELVDAVALVTKQVD